jgi:hypothetical protein
MALWGMALCVKCQKLCMTVDIRKETCWQCLGLAKEPFRSETD